MSDGVSTLVPDARRFFNDLARNNTREWWGAHKDRYEARLKAPAERLLDLVAMQIGPDVAPKLFRPQRDLRFSKDKTPYHLHLHMLWAVPEGPAYFFGISVDYLRVGAGVMGFDAGTLARWRTAVAEAGDLPATIHDLITLGYVMDPPELKRVPPPHPPDHPAAGLLRRKSCVLWNDIAPDETDLPGALIGHFRQLEPLVRRLAAI